MPAEEEVNYESKGATSNVLTCVRFRPLPANDPSLLSIEISGGDLTVFKPQNFVVTAPRGQAKDIERRTYNYHHVFPPSVGQTDVEHYFWPSIHKNITEGYNATVICYGQTGSGKTYTLSDNGLIQRLTAQVFRSFSREGGDHKNNPALDALPNLEY